MVARSTKGTFGVHLFTLSRSFRVRMNRRPLIENEHNERPKQQEDGKSQSKALDGYAETTGAKPSARIPYARIPEFDVIYTLESPSPPQQEGGSLGSYPFFCSKRAAYSIAGVFVSAGAGLGIGGGCRFL